MNRLSSSATTPSAPSIIRFQLFETPLGTMIAGATDAALCLVDFDGTGKGYAGARRLAERLGADAIEADSRLLQTVRRQLNEYFEGTRHRFSIPVQPMGTEFQQQVWGVLQQIPYGQTWSYRRQAEALGSPAAVRAVANANSKNPISIVIPCHRVIGSDGRLTGYAGGLWRKQFLLDLEQGCRTLF